MRISEAAGGRSRLVLLAGVSIIGTAMLVRAIFSGPSEASAGASVTDTRPSRASAPQAQVSTPPPVVIDWPVSGERDPFHSPQVFPPPAPRVVETPVVETEPATQRLQALVEEARARISLHSTVVGDRPMAVINGEPYRTGDVVAGFRITQIESRQIIIERDGITLLITTRN